MSFCPIIREKCKGNECVMWSDEECTIVNFFGQPIYTEIDDEYEGGEIESPTQEIPSWVNSASSEDIVNEYITFLQREFPDTESYYGYWSLFLDKIGCNSYGLPTELAMKFQKARILKDIEEEKLRNAKLDERRERESYQIDSWVDQYFDYMKSRNYPKVRQNDVYSFVRNRNLDILSETKREIYDLAKVKEEEQYWAQVELEKAELPSLIDQCIDWANSRRISRLTKSDIKSLLYEYKYTITDETEKLLYSLVNSKLKSKASR